MTAQGATGERLAKLVGRRVRVQLQREQSARTVYGVVRRVSVARDGGLRSLIVQRPGGAGVVTGSTYGARCRGERLRVRPDELDRIAWRGRLVALAEWIGGAA